MNHTESNEDTEDGVEAVLAAVGGVEDQVVPVVQVLRAGIDVEEEDGEAGGEVKAGDQGGDLGEPEGLVVVPGHVTRLGLHCTYTGRQSVVPQGHHA